MNADTWFSDEDHLVHQVHLERRTRYVSRTVAMTGFMGAGKSSIGRLVAAGLDRPFHDIDKVIERRTGSRIVDLFAAGREAAFRELEAEVTAEVARGPICVMSLGGGALARSATRTLLLEQCFVVHLHVPWPVLREQLPRLMATRPVLAGRTETEIHDLFLRRQRSYRSAHLRIELPRRDVKEASELVLSALGADRRG